MRKTFLSFFVLLISLSIGIRLQAQAPLAGAYTIDAAQATAGTNFQTFSEAVNALFYGVSAPVVFNVAVASGPYVEQISLSAIKGASAINTVTFNCNGATLQFASTNPTMRAGVKLDGAHHIIFDNLKVTPGTTNDEFSYGWGFSLIRDADSNIIRNCTVTLANNNTWVQNNIGIIIGGTDDYPSSNGLSYCDANIITGNTVTGGYWGIILDNYAGNYGLPFTAINDNQVTNNIIKNQLNSGIYVQWCNNTLVEGNDISGQDVATGIYLGETDYKTIVRNNRVHGFTLAPATVSYNTRAGISVVDCAATAGNDNLVANNLIYGFNSTESYRGIYLDEVTTHTNIYHNTISFDNTSSTAGDISGIYVGGKTISNLNVENNIVTLSDGGGGSKYGLYLEYPGVKYNISRNDYFVNATNGTVNMGRYNGHNYNTLTDFQTASGQDFHSVSVDPVYTALSTGNLLPTSQLLDNRGAYVGVSNDITGATRNNTAPDLGAYEFLSAPCSAPPVTGLTVIQPGTTICVNEDLALDLSGNSGGSGLSCQWQTSPTATGTFTNIGDVQASPSYDSKATATLYYRAQLTCAGSSVYSNPVQVIVNPYLPSGAYTINAGAPTAGTNFQSFNDALLAMGCGIAGPVVFNVAQGSGPYNEQLIIGPVTGASATNTVTFNGNGETLTYKSTNKNQQAVIKLTGASHIIFDSLHIIAAGASESTDYGIGVHMLLNADSNIIRKCKIDVLATGTGTRFAGIVINAADNTITGSGTSACDSNLIANNTITGGYYGIVNVTSDPVIMNVDNAILNNTIKDFYYAGVYTSGTDSSVISGNDVSRPSRTNTGGLYGLYAAFGSIRFKITGNRVHNLFGSHHASTTTVYGIATGGSIGLAATPSLISNNVIYDIASAGTQYGLYNSGSSYALYYHNTVSLDDSLSTPAKATDGFYQTGTAEGIEIKDNNFTLRRGSTSLGFAIYMNTAATTYTADYNNYLIASTGYFKTGYANATQFATLSDWQAQAPTGAPDAHSIAVRPGYTDPANGNLKPTADELDNKGTPVGITIDIDSVRRSTAHPDIGAYEFGCAGLPVANVQPDSVAICSGSPVTFTIDNPGTDTVYTWYDAATAGNAVGTGTSFTVNNPATTTIYWAEAAAPGGCISASRTRAIAAVFGPLTVAPVVTVDSAGADWIRFGWTAAPGAVGYQVSRDGINFTNPSSGPTGLTHMITGLNPQDTAGLIVRAIGSTDCQDILSNRAVGRTLSSQVFIPNMFSPNGDGRNDIFLVYSNAIREMHLLIFNQWGNKLFESNSPQAGWNGTYNGKDAPVGVYVYTVRITLLDGTVINKKGTINLLR